MSLLPLRVESMVRPGEPRVLGIDGEDADETFEALSSRTARSILAVIYDDPRTPPEVRDEVGTSLQNVHYHLAKLEAAGLIEPAGVGYSEKGNEMTVYGPASEAVVLFAGPEHERSRLRSLLERVFGLVVVVALATLGFAALLPLFIPDASLPFAETAGADGGQADRAGVAAETVGQAPGFDPVLAFLIGGLAVVAVLTIWWAVRTRAARP
jgi:DNA-binding transcriptional ArsR family regulator